MDNIEDKEVFIQKQILTLRNVAVQRVAHLNPWTKLPQTFLVFLNPCRQNRDLNEIKT